MSINKMYCDMDHLIESYLQDFPNLPNKIITSISFTQLLYIVYLPNPKSVDFEYCITVSYWSYVF